MSNNTNNTARPDLVEIMLPDGIEHEGYFQHKSTKEVYRVVRQGDTEQYTGRQVDGNGWFTNMWIDDSDIHDVNDFGFSG